MFSVDRTLGSGSVQQWNVSVQRQLTNSTTVELAYVGSNITHVGIPDSNLNQLTVDQLAISAPLLQRVQNPYYGIIPRSSPLGDPTTTVAQLMKPFPSYTTVSLYRNNVGNTRYIGSASRNPLRRSPAPAILAWFNSRSSLFFCRGSAVPVSPRWPQPHRSNGDRHGN